MNTKPQKWKTEESRKQRGDGNKIKYTNLGFESGQVVGFGKKARCSINCTFLG